MRECGGVVRISLHCKGGSGTSESPFSFCMFGGAATIAATFPFGNILRLICMNEIDTSAIRQNRSGNRFELAVGDLTAFVDYILMGKKIIYTHTEVPVSLEGRGIGSLLARSVMEFARENGLRVIPLCPFLASWLRTHTEYRDILADGVNV